MQSPVGIRFLRAVAGLVVMGCLWGPDAGVRAAETPARTVLLVRVPAGAGWEDLAFLAAVPAATVANDGAPALIALDESGQITREIDNYLLRYKPDALYWLGPAAGKPTKTERPWRVIPAESAGAAACALARTFWKSAPTAVLCREDDYAAALTASALAGRLRCPLLFVAESGPSAETKASLKALGVREALVLGSPANSKRGRSTNSAELSAPSPFFPVALEVGGLAVTQLRDAPAVLEWLRRRKMPATYLAVVNPRDRDATVIRKLSLAGPLLAAGRGGAVVPLAYEAVWKAGFRGEEPKEPPKGAPASRKTPRKGTIAVGGRDFAFVVTSADSDKDFFAANIDLNANGEFADAGEGPFRTGDVVTLAERRYSVTLGEKNGLDKADIRLTYPCADQIAADLRAHYAPAGGCPEHLCIVGFPDAIPQAIVREGGKSNRDLCSDYPFANADGDLFAEVALARLIAENVTFATLYASRVLTYEKLLDPAWCRVAGQARWENTYAGLFENVGFTIAPHHDVGNLKWIEKPTATTKGKRAKGFDANSPLTSVSALVHQAHSWWHDLGQTYDWESDVLIAPTLVESGGCLTTALDRQADFRSVVARLFRNGAVGYAGNALPAIAYQEQQRLVFWNAVLAGRTIGQAQRSASNGAAAVVIETDQLDGGPNHLQLYICGLFGDPAFRMHVPGEPRSAPARVEAAGDVVSVHAPAAWWPVRIRVPEDWKKWNDKDLYVLRGAGTYPNRHWVGEGYDAEETYVDAMLRTARRVKDIQQVQTPPKPLGWTGKYVTDENPDGTRTYIWRVRLVDFDQIAGKIIHQVDHLDYRVTFQ